MTGRTENTAQPLCDMITTGHERLLTKLEFQRAHTLCALSMHFQSTACHARAVITTLLLLVFYTTHASCLASLSSLTEAEPEIPSAAYMYK